MAVQAAAHLAQAAEVSASHRQSGFAGSPGGVSARPRTRRSVRALRRRPSPEGVHHEACSRLSAAALLVLSGTSLRSRNTSTLNGRFSSTAWST